MWQIKDFDAPDLASIANLDYEDSELSDYDYLKWLYHENPRGEAVIKLAVSDSDEVVGQYVVIPILIHSRGSNYLGTLSLNTLVKSDYRGKGIFIFLAQDCYRKLALDGYLFTIGFPNRNSYHGFIGRLSFSNIGSIALLIKPLNLKKLLARRVNKLAAMLIPRFIIHYQEKDLKTNICELNEEQVTLLDDFWSRITDKYNIIQVRDSKFIRWRYYRNPLRNYKLAIATVSERIVGYIVIRCVEIEGITNGMIVDFLIEPKHEQAGRDLINWALNSFIKNKADLVGALMLSHTQEYTILKRNGFFCCPKVFEPQPFSMIFRSHHPNYNYLGQIKDWFVTMGDYDVI